MAYDDLPLHGASTPPPDGSRRPSSAIRLVLVGLVGLGAGVLLALWWMSRTSLDPATPAPTEATDAAITSNRPKPQSINLPPLDASDTLLADLVSALSKHPLITRLLATEGLVRGATLSVVQIGEGRTPSTPLAALRPPTRLGVQGATSTAARVDPSSYVRWDGAVAALTSIAPADAAQLYVNVKPLFDQAYRDLGHPDGNFDEAIVEAIQVLQATPPVDGPLAVVRRPGYYEHEDPALRALRPVQKQFLLIGPENRQRVLQWLRQVAANLDLSLQ